MTTPWARWAAERLAEAGFTEAPAGEREALLALLAAGTIVTTDHPDDTRALARARLALAALPARPPEGRDEGGAVAALLLLGHRDLAARLTLRAAAPDGGAVEAAFRAWTGGPVTGRPMAGAAGGEREGGDAEGAAATVARVVGERVALAPRADRDELEVEVRATPGRWLRLERLRVGATTLDLAVRARGEVVTLGAARRAGPPIQLVARLAGAPATLVEADEVALPGPDVRLELRAEHEVRWYR